MGWSCSAEANTTLHNITREIFNASKHERMLIQNVYRAPNNEVYIVELSRREYDDGAITGSVMKVVEGDAFDPNGGCKVVRSGGFRIDGDGTFRRGPAWLRKLAETKDSR